MAACLHSVSFSCSGDDQSSLKLTSLLRQEERQDETQCSQADRSTAPEAMSSLSRGDSPCPGSSSPFSTCSSHTLHTVERSPGLQSTHSKSSDDALAQKSHRIARHARLAASQGAIPLQGSSEDGEDAGASPTPGPFETRRHTWGTPESTSRGITAGWVNPNALHMDLSKSKRHRHRSSSFCSSAAGGLTVELEKLSMKEGKSSMRAERTLRLKGLLRDLSKDGKSSNE